MGLFPELLCQHTRLATVIAINLPEQGRPAEPVAGVARGASAAATDAARAADTLGTGFDTVLRRFGALDAREDVHTAPGGAGTLGDEASVADETQIAPPDVPSAVGAVRFSVPLSLSSRPAAMAGGGDASVGVEVSDVGCVTDPDPTSDALASVATRGAVAAASQDALDISTDPTGRRPTPSPTDSPVDVAIEGRAAATPEASSLGRVRTEVSDRSGPQLVGVSLEPHPGTSPAPPRTRASAAPPATVASVERPSEPVSPVETTAGTPPRGTDASSRPVADPMPLAVLSASPRQAPRSDQAPRATKPASLDRFRQIPQIPMMGQPEGDPEGGAEADVADERHPHANIDRALQLARPSDEREPLGLPTTVLSRAGRQSPALIRLGGPRLPATRRPVTPSGITLSLDMTGPTSVTLDTFGATVSSSPTTTAPGPDLVHQFVKALKLQWHDGGGEARLRLHPEHLGEVLVLLQVRHGAVTAVLQAGSDVVRGWIRTHQQDLKNALSEQGLTLEQLVVEDEGQRRGRHDREPEPERGRRPRRLPESRFEIHV